MATRRSSSVRCTAQPVSGLKLRALGAYAHVTAISCPLPGNCGAVGFADHSTSRGLVRTGFVVSEVSGTWGRARIIVLPGGELDAVSCASPGNCTAAGGSVVGEVKGVWGTPVVIKASFGTARIDVGSVSCPAPGRCAVTGVSVNQAVVASQAGATWGAAGRLAGAAALEHGGGSALSSVSCASAGDCTAGGYGDFSAEAGSSTREYASAFIATERNGIWGAVRPPPAARALRPGQLRVIRRS